MQECFDVAIDEGLTLQRGPGQVDIEADGHASTLRSHGNRLTSNSCAVDPLPPDVTVLPGRHSAEQGPWSLINQSRFPYPIRHTPHPTRHTPRLRFVAASLALTHADVRQSHPGVSTGPAHASWPLLHGTRRVRGGARAHLRATLGVRRTGNRGRQSG